ncbi:hypothetical protein ACOSZH_25240 [Priestia megaterium]|uniref:hypothetical protein n=1 Tax=Priestia megaterium TaxID=1404 RepID=UPI003BA051DC
MIPINHPDLSKLSLEHFEAVREQLIINGTYAKVDSWFKKNGLGISTKKVITASVPYLEKIALSYNGITPITDLKDMYNNRFSKSRRWIGKNKYTSAKLVEKLGIRVCPYCNRNYINNVSTDKAVKRTSQLDHFFNKKDYPFLAMSFFNLIPACPACNLLKHKFDVSASPYDKRINWDDAVKFSFGITTADFLNDEQKVYVKVRFSDELDKNFSVLKLSNQYLMHNDLLHELLIKGLIYSPTRLEEIKNNFSGLFQSDKDMMRVIYGNYLEKDDLGKRPLSKLTKDIVDKLYF